MEHFGTLNWAILVAYALVTLLIGFVAGKGVETADAFYLGQRKTQWWAIGVSVIATYISALTFLGAPSWAYTDGFSVIALHSNYPLVIFFSITLFLPFFYNSGVASIYEYQERRFGPKARGLIAAIFLVSQSMTTAAILYATALVIAFITGVDVVYSIIIVSAVTLVYTALGGITSVIWTDVFQAGVLFLGAIIILFLLIHHLPMPLADTLAALKAQGKLNPLVFKLDFGRDTTVWAGVIAMTLYHVTVYGTNQMMVQRALAAKSIGDAKKAYLTMGYAAFFIYFMFILMGVLFYSYYQGKEFEDTNTIILQFAQGLAIPGLVGVLAAAVLAASMSTLASALNSLATIATVDFYQKYYRKDGTPLHYLNASRLFTIVFAILTVIPAIALTHSKGSILLILSNIGSYFVGAQLGMFAAGFFSKHATEKGVLVGTLVGFIAVWIVATLTTIAWPWYCLIGAASNIVVTIIASLLIDGRQKEYSPYTIPGQIRAFERENRPQKDKGWYLVPGKIDKSSYLLLVFFLASLVFLFVFQLMI
jgi:SSS family solute:Na+ symporter